ncbi:hypothetical protein UNSW2_1203 [Campylobacter concisus UNSW2]|uniref:Uncharacterized protein n=1 Tax=Campylobacter concisus UNSW2 TaxID=1242965 RepID=U2FKV7_9BACT|nr:hypothetical protein UNSW2_1203 [Campylobacter concisus UNSW2]
MLIKFIFSKQGTFLLKNEFYFLGGCKKFGFKFSFNGKK